MLHSMWDLSSRTRDRTQAPVVEVWHLNHWISREVPLIYFCCLLLRDTDLLWYPMTSSIQIHYDYSTECEICLLFLFENVVSVKTLSMFLLRNLFKFAWCNLSVHTHTYTNTHIMNIHNIIFKIYLISFKMSITMSFQMVEPGVSPASPPLYMQFFLHRVLHNNYFLYWGVSS